ncbi:MAG: hypothetical protein LBS86_03265 [Treponema sp.]|jgi:SH3-like domain-containing protein|nr:hypothetical protein [Treponema sp.]
MNNMKRCVMTLVIGLVALAALSAQTRGATMYVAAKQADVKSSTGLIAEKRGSVAYGDPVLVLQVQGKWCEIRTAGQGAVSGWVQTTALTSRRIVVGGVSSSASASEIALAGKGFSARTEQTYKTAGHLNYAQVDLMETEQVSDADMYDFLTSGQLKTGD